MIDVKATASLIKKTVKSDKNWLLAIGVSLITINLALIWREDQPDLFNISCLFWAAISFVIWERRHKLNLESDIFSSVLGLLLVAFVFLRSAFPAHLGGIFYLLPVISALGLALLASSIQRLQQYKRELISLFLLCTANLLRPRIFDISIFTAKFSAFILWYTGSEVTRSGVEITLPTGVIKVYEGCSGIAQIFDLLVLALLFMLMFPRKWQQKILVPIVAVIIGFIVNAVRVSLMALLVRQDNLDTFEYWHSGNGSLIFSLVAALIFGCFCWFLLRSEAESHNITES
ncbi:MAG: cyanoexosortase A [Goleter apudmare HA4340-LM2]|jgi:cyanoexosortase A|nr:cyanoexosortase A [Goleter apudmare HA4340-LM2]